MRTTRTSLLTTGHSRGDHWVPMGRQESMLVVAALLLPFVLTLSAGHLGDSAAMTTPAGMTNVDVKPMVSDTAWMKMQVMATPEIVGKAFIPNYQFNVQSTVPAVQVKGSDIDNKLPPALWVKLEQPGQAFLYIDSDAGVFVKPLIEATPGFVSRCKLGRTGYAADNGDFVELDTAHLSIKSLWIVQDASTEGAHVPGFVAIAPADFDALPPYIAQK